MSGQSGATPTISQRLAERLCEPPDEEARDRAALHLIDWVGCAIAAKKSSAGRAMWRAFEVGDDPFDWRSASMRLGALGNVLEMDDVDKRALLHPGPVVIPAALVAASRANVDDGALLDAIVRGYEATIRVGRAVGPQHYRVWHNTGTCGPFGAAAAAGSIIGLDARDLSGAFGLAGTQSSGFWQVRHEPASHAKQLHTARATHAGLSAAYLVKAGFIGIETVFEGTQGFFAAMCPDGDADEICAPANDWAIHEVSFKPWPACRHAHAAIDAALAARADGVDHGAIAGGVIGAFADAATFCDKPSPQDSLSAKFSLQHAVAVTLLFGEPTLDHFEGERLADPEISALRQRLLVEVDPLLTDRYPARFGARLALRLQGGETRTYDMPDAFGDPENPMSRDDLARKFYRLSAYAGVDAPSDGVLSALIGGPRRGVALRDWALSYFSHDGMKTS